MNDVPEGAREHGAVSPDVPLPMQPASTSGTSNALLGPRTPQSRPHGGGTSSVLYGRAQRVIPGGVNSPVRAMRSIGRDPIFIASGSGSQIKDVDGNTYIDWVCSWGPLILGHGNPQVLHAITHAAALGSTFGAATEGEVRLAEEICRRMPAVEMVRMTSSGT